MEFNNGELLFILDALKRREIELSESKQDNSESYRTSIELQERIIGQMAELNAIICK